MKEIYFKKHKLTLFPFNELLEQNIESGLQLDNKKTEFKNSIGDPFGLIDFVSIKAYLSDSAGIEQLDFGGSPVVMQSLKSKLDAAFDRHTAHNENVSQAVFISQLHKHEQLALINICSSNTYRKINTQSEHNNFESFFTFMKNASAVNLFDGLISRDGGNKYLLKLKDANYAISKINNKGRFEYHLREQRIGPEGYFMPRIELNFIPRVDGGCDISRRFPTGGYSQADRQTFGVLNKSEVSNKICEICQLFFTAVRDKIVASG